jgi:hypothetical protein
MHRMMRFVDGARPVWRRRPRPRPLPAGSGAPTAPPDRQRQWELTTASP